MDLHSKLDDGSQETPSYMIRRILTHLWFLSIFQIRKAFIFQRISRWTSLKYVDLRFELQYPRIDYTAWFSDTIFFRTLDLAAVANINQVRYVIKNPWLFLFLFFLFGCLFFCFFFVLFVLTVLMHNFHFKFMSFYW